MQLETVKFTPKDLAKYPFLKETAAYMKKLGLKIEELANSEMERILNRAEERVCQSILFVSVGSRCENDLEIPSFPVAIMLAIATGNHFIKKRYALAEAKQAFSDMQLESRERFMAISRNFDWYIASSSESGIPMDYYSLAFTDYLRNVTHLRDEKWKLANRLLASSKVFLNQHDAARLLQEEIQRRIEKRLEATEVPSFPQKITEIAEKMNALAKEKIGESEMEGFPKVVAQSAFPPCIVSLYDAATNGRHLSHVGRFTLTSFLVTIGMPAEKVAEVFKSFSDYNARLTRYQVEHIAGERGSGTRYTPPSCSTLQTHGVCIAGDDLCRRVRHPLSYYLKKQKMPSSTAS
jgi:DNA primase large subunit